MCELFIWEWHLLLRLAKILYTKKDKWLGFKSLLSKQALIKNILAGNTNKPVINKLLHEKAIWSLEREFSLWAQQS